MKTKLLALVAVALLALSVLAVLPAFPYEAKAVKYIEPEELKLTGPCIESTRFDAKVKITNVNDLYAWDISVYWDTTYLRLEGYKIQWPTEWPADTYSVIINETNVPVKPLPASSASLLHFAVTRLGNVSGFTGTTTLAILSFHVIYEPLWPERQTTLIQFDVDSLSDACGKPIDHYTYGSTIKLISSKPNIEVLFSDKFDLTKNETQGWIKNQVITAYVWLSSVTKLWEVKVKVGWNPHLLDIDYQQITINEEKFPQPWKKLEMDISDTIINSSTLYYGAGGWGGWSDKEASKLGWVLSCTVENVGTGEGDYAQLIRWVPGASVTVDSTTYTYPNTPFGYTYDASIPETGYILQNDNDQDQLKLILEYPSALTVTIGRPNETEKYLKGTFWLLKLDFKVKCVMNTTNTANIPSTSIKTGVPIPVNTWIEPVDGYMKMSATTYTHDHATYNFTLSKARYYFTPIPYDFDQSGHVGVEDIKIILYNYGISDTAFDPSGTVDIYDVVKVAKAYCNKVPPPIPKP